MAGYRLRADLFIPEKIAEKHRDKIIELHKWLKEAKAYSVRINEGKSNEEFTVKASWHRCHHDTGGVCEPEQEI